MAPTPDPVSVSTSFADALRTGRTVGYVIAATPLRFACLASDMATSFAEIGEENCGHIFATRGDARRQLHRIPARDRLGWIHVVRKVSYFGGGEPPHGPRLDVRGHPFALRIHVVDRAGKISPWPHGGRFGWISASKTAGHPSPVTGAPHAPQSRMRRIFR
ncbi:MAG: hypothetical protein HZA93_04235 [Verrucomicrobia bacterium]|nr:hypothetical protein [Verrucomicrobiota bacterium]